MTRSSSTNLTTTDDTGMKQQLTLGDIGQWLDMPVPHRARTSWFDSESDMTFLPLRGADRDQAILSVLQELQLDSLQPSGGHRLPAWERGWGEILEQIEKRGLTYDNLRPQYFRHDTMRLKKDYVAVEGRRFEFAACHAIKAILYANLIQDGDQIVDLGTGTASNVFLLLKMFERSEVIGCDWAKQSNSLTDRVGHHFGGRARGVRLDMLSLEGLDRVGEFEGSVVLSVHAFEQLGDAFDPILAAIVAGRPRLVVQIEPILQNYEAESLIDYLAIRYHEKRNYLNGYLPALRALQDEDRVDILKSIRLPVGNMFHEPYGVLVWRPL